MSNTLISLTIASLLAISLLLPTLTHSQAQSLPAPPSQQVFDSLLAKSQSEGSVRVIVGLRVDGYQPEGKLRNANAVNAQRLAITHVQEVLAARLPALDLNSVKQFKFIPF